MPFSFVIRSDTIRMGYNSKFTGIAMNIAFNMTRNSMLLRVSNLEYHFEMTYLRAPKELEFFIADLAFSAKRHFLCNFFLKNFHGKKVSEV